MLIPKMYKTLLSLSDNEINLYNTSTLTLTVKLIDFNGNPIIGETVIAFLTQQEGDSQYKLCERKTNSNGIITCTIDCTALDVKHGLHTVSVNDATIHFNSYFDSGWLSPTLNSGFSISDANNPLKYRKINNFVNLRGSVKLANAVSAGNSVNIGTVPLEYAPSNVKGAPITDTKQQAAANMFYIDVGSTGNIRLRGFANTSNVNIAANTVLYFELTYMSD